MTRPKINYNTICRVLLYSMPLRNGFHYSPRPYSEKWSPTLMGKRVRVLKNKIFASPLIMEIYD